MTELYTSKERIVQAFLKENQQTLDYIKRLIYKHDGLKVTAEKPFTMEDHSDMMKRALRLSQCDFGNFLTLVEGIPWNGNNTTRLQFAYCYMMLAELDRQIKAFDEMVTSVIKRTLDEPETLFGIRPPKAGAVEMSEEQDNSAVAGIGRKEPQSAVEIRDAVDKAMEGGVFEQSLAHGFLEGLAEHIADKSLKQISADITTQTAERTLELKPGEGPSADFKSDSKWLQDWLALAVKPFEVEAQERITAIRDSVMKHLGFTEVSQLMPLGLKYHLSRLAGHRSNNDRLYAEEVRALTPEQMVERLHWMNQLATLNTYVEALTTTNYQGRIEPMSLQTAALNFTGQPIEGHLKTMYTTKDDPKA